VINENQAARAYHNYITNVIDDSTKIKREEEEEKQDEEMENDIIIDRDDGLIYRLPPKNIVIDFANYTKR
jgi:hypothetical protein